MEGRCRRLDNDQPGAYEVKIDLANQTEIFSSLFSFFTEMWLICNCKSHWRLEKLPHLSQVVVSFQDPREAVFFKLSRQFDRAFSLDSKFLSVKMVATSMNGMC